MELPGRCGDWLDTATVTAQGLTLPTTRRTRNADFYLAKNADLHMATTADFFMATDTNLVVTKRDGEIELDPHADGFCKLTLAKDEAVVLRDALTRWLG
jgi:hypothetical protein